MHGKTDAVRFTVGKGLLLDWSLKGEWDTVRAREGGGSGVRQSGAQTVLFMHILVASQPNFGILYTPAIWQYHAGANVSEDFATNEALFGKVRK